MQTSAIFPLFYLPPVNYFSVLKLQHYHFILEKQEHFVKQTFRNRTTIASPNGVLNLFIPVVKGSKVHTPFKDVKISYDLKWQRLHWLSLQTCYRSSAYFEFYEDDLSVFYHQKYDYLFDFNLKMLDWVFKQIKIVPKIDFTEIYDAKIPQNLDFRHQFTTKSIASESQKTYFQVFDARNGFLANLSIIDLIFNQGPQTQLYL